MHADFLESELLEQQRQAVARRKQPLGTALLQLFFAAAAHDGMPALPQFLDTLCGYGHGPSLLAALANGRVLHNPVTRPALEFLTILRPFCRLG
jgi:hypothetical protein